MATAAPTDEQVDKVRMQRIKQQEAHVRELEVAYKTQQEETKNAREELSDAIFQLRRLIRGEVEEQAQLDFGDTGEPTEDSWDALISSTKLIDAVTLTKPHKKKLDDLGVITVKHFEQLRASELPGISGGLSDHFSEAACDKIEDAVLDWMDRQRVNRFIGRTDDDDDGDDSGDELVPVTPPRTVGGRPVKGRK